MMLLPLSLLAVRPPVVLLLWCLSLLRIILFVLLLVLLPVLIFLRFLLLLFVLLLFFLFLFSSTTDVEFFDTVVVGYLFAIPFVVVLATTTIDTCTFCCCYCHIFLL